MEGSVVVYDDEVIAGSENEDENEDENETMGGFAGPTGGLGLRHSSPFSAFPPTNQPYKLNITHSSISNFTAGPSAIADYSSRIDSSERGHDKGKDTDLDTSITSITGTYTKFDDILTSSIADRAKTRQRPKNHSASTSLDVIELTTEDEDEISLKPSKPRPRLKPKLKIKPIPKDRERPAETHTTSVQINPPQDSAPAAAPPRPRPRPRPRVKRTVPEDEAPAPLPPTSTPPSELPIATLLPRPAHTTTSQLLPSDPPPSPGAAYNDDPNTRAPPIDVLFDGPLSSPNSLFNDNGITSKKRKRNLPGSDKEIDQLASSQDPPRRLFPAHTMYDSSPHGMPPPPTFFAGSSSSSIGRERQEPDTFTPPPPKPDIVDLTMLPPTMVPAPRPKPKKSKKKVDLSMFDENFEGAMIVLDEDNQDDDFDPRGEGSSKKTKAKTKEKPTKSKSKAKTSLNGADAPGKGKVVEVLLDPRPSSKGKGKGKALDGTPISKTTDKGKKKKDSSANKEVFKSREFVEDSDDELDIVPRVGRSEGTTAGSVNAGSIASVKVNAISKATPSAPLSKSAIPSSSKPKENSPHRSLSPLSDLDFEMDDAGPSITKRPAGGAKKRKSVVDSDGEDDDFGMAADEVIRVNPAPKISAKKRKTETAAVKKGKRDGQKKSRNVVLSDDEEPHEAEEETAVKPTKPPKTSAKQSKKVILDDDDEEAGAEVQQVEEQQSTPEEIKENVVPATSKLSVAPTPRPSNIPRPSISSTNGEHKTPIYARYEIAPRKSSLPMSELIRRANSMPGSPFPSTPSAIGPSRLKGLTVARTPLAYSPLLKSSRSMLSRIAPLHPNRRTPPPPPPPPPPRKKTKKELELEEKWEEEMVESVGGMEAWAVLGDNERKEIRKAKLAMELGGWDD